MTKSMANTNHREAYISFRINLENTVKIEGYWITNL
jgi:hypothetical protein